MSTPNLLFRSAVLFTAFAATGCKTEQRSSAPTAERPAQLPTARISLNDEAAKNLNELLAAYERNRVLLADDLLEQVPEAAASLHRLARDAAGQLPANVQPHVQAIASAAEALAATAASDAGALRRAFGEVSRPVVGLLTAEPKLAEGRHLFECPMADGFQKWVQTNDKISNPYMGKRMLACGSAVAWR